MHRFTNPTDPIKQHLKNAIMGLPDRLEAVKYLNGGHVDRKQDRIRAKKALQEQLAQQEREEAAADALADAPSNRQFEFGAVVPDPTDISDPIEISD